MMMVAGGGGPTITWFCPPLIGYWGWDEGLVSRATEASGLISLDYPSLGALEVSWPLRSTRDFGLYEIASDFSYHKHFLRVEI